MEEVLKKLFDAVLEGDFESVKSNLQAALDAKLDPTIILNNIRPRCVLWATGISSTASARLFAYAALQQYASSRSLGNL